MFCCMQQAVANSHHSGADENARKQAKSRSKSRTAPRRTTSRTATEQYAHLRQAYARRTSLTRALKMHSLRHPLISGTVTTIHGT